MLNCAAGRLPCLMGHTLKNSEVCNKTAVHGSLLKIIFSLFAASCVFSRRITEKVHIETWPSRPRPDLICKAYDETLSRKKVNGPELCDVTLRLSTNSTYPDYGSPIDVCKHARLVTNSWIKVVSLIAMVISSCGDESNSTFRNSGAYYQIFLQKQRHHLRISPC